MAKKEIKQHALDQLLKESELMLDETQRGFVMESLDTYREFGYIEAPGADRVPYQSREDVPFGAMWVFLWFLLENGEDYVTAVAEMDKGYGDIVNTFGRRLEDM